MTDHLLDARGSWCARKARQHPAGGRIAHEVGNPLGAIGTMSSAAASRRRPRSRHRCDPRARAARPHRARLSTTRDPGEVLARSCRRVAQSAYGCSSTGCPKRCRRLELVPCPPCSGGPICWSKHRQPGPERGDAAPGGTVILRSGWAFESRRASPKRESDPQRTPFTGPESPRAHRLTAGQRECPGRRDRAPGCPRGSRKSSTVLHHQRARAGDGLGLAIVARAVHDMGGVCGGHGAEGGRRSRCSFRPPT